MQKLHSIFKRLYTLILCIYIHIHICMYVHYLFISNEKIIYATIDDAHSVFMIYVCNLFLFSRTIIIISS